MVTNPLQDIIFPPQDPPPPPLLVTRKVARVEPQQGPVGEMLVLLREEKDYSPGEWKDLTDMNPQEPGSLAWKWILGVTSQGQVGKGHRI